MVTDSDHLLTRVEGGVLLCTLNRPAARNALTPALVEDLHSVLDGFVEDPEVRAGVLTGTGSAFCAGLDLTVFAKPGADRARAASLIRRFGRLAKPVIGAINGAAVAGGLEIALGCDFLVGSPRAMFADTHVRIGAFPGGGTTARLPRAVGVRTAKAMSLGGMRLDAQAAWRAGLLAEIVEPDQLVDRALTLASEMAGADQDLVRVVRGLMDDNADRDLREALTVEAEELQFWRASGRNQWKV